MMILLIYFILLHLFFVLINDSYIPMYICGILWEVRTGKFGINLAVIASWPHGLHSRPSVAEAYAVHLEE